MASRLTLLRNLTFRRNLRLLCSQVRRSLYHKLSLPWFFEMTTYFFQSRPSLARTRSILPHASFQLNAISFDKVTSRVLILFQYFIIILRISVFPIPFKLSEDGKPRTGFAISKNNLRFVWTFLYQLNINKIILSSRFVWWSCFNLFLFLLIPVINNLAFYMYYFTALSVTDLYKNS